jgi:class 3 adenylate cyclase/pimeloyl-ACP methyl ester carboxylesterase
MGPQIRYAQTEDGVSIAYWTLGSGSPLVLLPPLPFTHVQLEWEIEPIRSWYEKLATQHVIARYDGRGFGLSQREVDDYSLDGLARDLEAVVQRLDGSVALMAPLNAGPVAVKFAANNEDRVSRLILWCTYARGALFFDRPETVALRSLVDSDWRTFCQTSAHAREGWSESDAANKFARLINEASTPSSQGLFMDAMRMVDVRGDLADVKCPTLVVHRKNWEQLGQGAARELAAGINGSRLAILEGSQVAPYLGNSNEALRCVLEFLGSEVPPAPASATNTAEVSVIFFADIVDSTALTEKLGDAEFRDRARSLDSSLRTAIREAGGTPVDGKLLGDGVLGVFSSAQQGIYAALRCAEAGDSIGLPLHLGIHAGDVIREEGNVYGGAVNIAARVAAISAAGQVLVSQTVRELARTSADVSFTDRGEHALKGVGEPVRVFEVSRGS